MFEKSGCKQKKYFAYLILIELQKIEKRLELTRKKDLMGCESSRLF